MFNKCIEQDMYFAIAYLRGNSFIDYTQLGLAYKLKASDVCFNKSLCFIATNDLENVDLELQKANQLLEQGQYLPEERKLVEVPENSVFRPPDSKVKAATKELNYLGNSKVIASLDERDTFVGFKGPQIRRALQSPIEDLEKRINNQESLVKRSMTTINVKRKPSEASLLHKLNRSNTEFRVNHKRSNSWTPSDNEPRSINSPPPRASIPTGMIKVKC
ncbi:hypothetical protein O9G_006265, partial [Rozella allomycis CSF55]